MGLTFHGLEYARLPDENLGKWVRDLTFIEHSLEEANKTLMLGSEASFALREKARRSSITNISAEMRDALHRLVIERSSDALVLHNLPTVNGDEGPDRTSPIPELVLAGLIESAGCEFFSYLQEQYGRIFQRVIPIDGLEDVQSNAGRNTFNWHTDNFAVLQPFRPEFLALIGVSNAPEVATILLLLETDILPKLPERLLRALQQPIYIAASPVSFEFGGPKIITEPRPIIYRDAAGKYNISLPAADYAANSEEALRNLKEFREFLSKLPPRFIVLQPGWALLFNNSRVLHGRQAFTGWREAVRAYFSTSLANFRIAAGSIGNVFDARPLMLG